jgi:hypothetical protein
MATGVRKATQCQRLTFVPGSVRFDLPVGGHECSGTLPTLCRSAAGQYLAGAASAAHALWQPVGTPRDEAFERSGEPPTPASIGSWLYTTTAT